MSSKPCKVVYKYMEDGTKVRVSKRSGCVIPKPPHLADRKDFKSRSGYLGIITMQTLLLNFLLVLWSVSLRVVWILREVWDRIKCFRYNYQQHFLVSVLYITYSFTFSSNRGWQGHQGCKCNQGDVCALSGYIWGRHWWTLSASTINSIYSYR